jgi:isopenicillin-N epimerase
MNDIRQQWSFPAGTVYLNHGSFGPAPLPVQSAQRTWQERMNRQPMDFFARHFEDAWIEARRVLAAFMGSVPRNLVFVENATAAMNIVANSFPLTTDDEVVLTNHEYGAVLRTWQQACHKAGAVARIIRLPAKFSTVDDVVECVSRELSPRTRMLVVSHITSPTAVVLPVRELCRLAKSRGVAICIDGPHAVAQLPVAIDALECDYYTASCHKWLSAPYGSGFLYVHPHRQPRACPLQWSWGRLPPRERSTWDHEFIWTGTRDPTPYLAVPAAIRFLEQVGLDRFRAQTHALATYARSRLESQFRLQPVTENCAEWYGSMVLARLPACDAHKLQSTLFQRFGIEVPIITWDGRQFVRVSCHLYTTHTDIDLLVSALSELLGEGTTRTA